MQVDFLGLSLNLLSKSIDNKKGIITLVLKTYQKTDLNISSNGVAVLGKKSSWSKVKSGQLQNIRFINHGIKYNEAWRKTRFV